MSEVRVRLAAWRMSGHPVQVHHLLSVHTDEMNERPLPGTGTTPLNDRNWVVVTEEKGCRFRPLVDIRRRIQSAAMRYKRFAACFRKDANLTFWSIVAVVSLIWILTVVDLVFDLGWGWDREGLLTAPVILLIAVAIRFWQAAVNKLINYLFNGS